MKYAKKLVGDKIYLAPMRIEDAEQFVEWLNDFSTTDYIGCSGKVIGLEKEEEVLKKMQTEEVNFSIVRLADDKLIGTVSLNRVDHIRRIASLGIFIGDKESREKGYGTEAVRLILDYGFSYLNLNNIDLSCFAANERAYRCYLKCGFKEYGRRRQATFTNGKYDDLIFMDILAEEWTESYIRNKEL